jgi:SAM-dependent methyltransferase
MANLRQILFKLYYPLESLLAPGLKNAQFAYRDILTSKLSPETRWLDIGCGRRLFPGWMPNSEEHQTFLRANLKATFGLDPDFASLRDNRFVQNRVLGNSASLPFASASFDLLSANMVIEHVAEPEAVLTEALRVLKPNGIFLFHTPNARSYATLMARLIPEPLKVRLVHFFEGRKEEDVFPTLYRMNTAVRVRKLSQRAGFQIAELIHVESSAQAVMLGPFVLFELVWIRFLRIPALRNLRSNLIVVLQKSAQKQSTIQ